MSPENIDELADAIAQRLTAGKDDRPLLSPLQVAERLGVSERTARELTKEGGPIASFKVEGVRRVEPSAVDAYIERKKGEAALSGYPGEAEPPEPTPADALVTCPNCAGTGSPAGNFGTACPTCHAYRVVTVAEREAFIRYWARYGYEV